MAEAVILILLWRIAVVIAQPGFLSIDCGGKSNYTDQNGIEWVPDDDYIEIGEKVPIENSSLPLFKQSHRVFPGPLNKSCYKVPIVPNVPHLVRMWFYNANYSGLPDLPIFKLSIETPGMLTVKVITNEITERNIPNEWILVSSGDVLFNCLIRISDVVNPFITAMELRTLRQGMYPQVNPGTMLQMEARYDPGGNSTIRYPQDPFDRVWNPLNIEGTKYVLLEDTISTDAFKELPPSAVLQTANVAPEGTNSIDIHFQKISNPLVWLYFAEVQMLNASESRTFNVVQASGKLLGNISLLRNFSATEVWFTFEGDKLSLYNPSLAGPRPLINAFEYYQLITTEVATDSTDVDALAALKKQFKINEWISDPCYAIPWDGLQCSNGLSSVRVSGINLSGRNLTGSIPTGFGRMTELINISLANNNFSGRLADLSNVTKLERINLQNNSLTGEIPEWLFNLHNLKELHIDNNNFSGVIAQRFLDRIYITYDGNPYLSILQETSTKSNSKRSNVGIISGIISGGIIILGLISCVSIIVYRKKFGEKGTAGADYNGNVSGTKPVNSQNPEYSMILVPNMSKSRAFTIDEMMIATKEFSSKIGQGGFGSVFLGELQNGKQIAVKVLSTFSNQGASEFLNEINLLSRVHHKNLVSLLGYCNRSRELMLVYEYMIGGSLKDRLYGSSSGDYQNLDWKTRLDIALDAARGLEYLHVSCRPKIIHRDIKTANILLDKKLTGKLADFGISILTMDGEASHVITTVKGSIGYLDPEYFKTNILTDKTDIYSFGVILLEIICGRAPVDAKLSQNEINLVRWVTPFLDMVENTESFVKIVDKRLRDNYTIKSIAHVAKLAIRCVADSPLSRPNASEILVDMKVAMQYHAESVDLSEEIDIDYQDQQTSQCSLLASTTHKDIGSPINSSAFFQMEN